MKNRNIAEKITQLKSIFIVIIILFVCVACSKSTSNIVMIPIGEGHDTIILDNNVEVTIFFPSSYGSISNVTLTAKYRDNPFFNLWKKYADSPDNIELLNYKIIRKTKTILVINDNRTYYRSKLDDNYIMEVDLSENFINFLKTNCENCIMISLIKTLLINKSAISSGYGSIHLTVNGKPLVTQNHDYTAPITINSLDQLCNHLPQ